MLNPFMRWLNRSPTVAERLKVHWQILQLRGYTPQTLRLKRHYTSILIKQFGWRKLDRVTRLELHQWLAERAKTMPSHTKSLLIFIRDFYREAINDGVTKYNPADRIKLQPHAVKRKRLSDAEYLRMLDRIPKDHYFLRAFKLALTIGQRRADIVKLKFSDVWDGHLHLIQQKNEKKHPARLAIPLEIRNPLLEQNLGEIIDECRHNNPTDYIIVGAFRRPVGRSQLSVLFQDFRDHPEMLHEPTFHEIRSLAERTYRDIGIDTQRLLGHKHAKMTEEYDDPRNLPVYRRVLLPNHLPQCDNAAKTKGDAWATKSDTIGTKNGDGAKITNA